MLSSFEVCMDLCFCFFCIGFVSGCCLLLLFSLLSSAKRIKKRNLSWADNMNLVHHLLERLRSVISLKGWDYCVIWKLSDDQRFLEWVDCCCAGSDPIIQNGDGDEVIFPVSSVSPCRDTIVQHPRTKPCHLLAELPLSMPLDSGIYAQTLMSNQATWLNLESNCLQETDGTRVLIPVPIGLVELFVAKHVPAENREITNYVAAQCNIFIEQEAAVHCSTSSTMESAMMTEINTPLLIHSSAAETAAASDSPSLPYDVYVDRIHLSEAARSSKNDTSSFFEELNNDHFEDQTSSIMMMMMESNSSKEQQQQQQQDKGDSVKRETGRSDSISDCSEEDDDDDAKHRRRTGKGPQSKNLVAERKRRKKLNDKLYALRSLVPKISKLDRASILGDAIEFVKELQKQVKDLQNELEEQSGDNHDDQGVKGGFNSNGRSEFLDQNGMTAVVNHLGLKREEDSKACKNMGGATSINSTSCFAEPARTTNHDSSSNIYDKRQMEPQVEVVPLLDGNEFFVKVFSEFKTGGFVRLMESLDFLGLEVTNVNVNRFISLVSYVFKVEKRDSEMVQADHVRDSLLEITRNPTAGREWCEIMTTKQQLSSSDNGSNNVHVDHDHRHHHHHHITTSRNQFHQHQQ